MSDGTDKDAPELEDSILGTALARAVDAQPARETPFEASRVAARLGRPARSFLPRAVWPVSAIAAAVVLGLVVGSAVLGQRRAAQTPVASQPVATLAVASSPSARVTGAPQVAAPVPTLVYFARPRLPPIAATVLAHLSAANGTLGTVESRVSDRVIALLAARPGDVPAGAYDPIGPSRNWTQETVHVSNDAVSTATVDLQLDPAPAPPTTADAKAIVQQLVYTITEEPGVDRVVLLSKGKPMILGSYTVPSTPLTRGDVAGYAVKGITGTLQFQGAAAPSQLTTSYSTESVAPALGRFTITVAFKQPVPARTVPQFTVTASDQTHMPGANAELEITIPDGEDTTTAAAQVDRPPLRSIAIGSPVTFPAKVYRLGLDQLWPWRAVVLFDPTRIVIDIGGPPSGISADQNTAVYSPAPNAQVGHTFTLSGAARAYEATVTYRVLDDHGQDVASGSTNATIGTSDLWGAYDTQVSIPSSVSGHVVLEVYEVSPKDGTHLGLVRIPLTVR